LNCPEIDETIKKNMTNSPGFKKCSGCKLYDFWRDILTEYEREKFRGGHWDKALSSIKDDKLKDYLIKRYG